MKNLKKIIALLIIILIIILGIIVFMINKYKANNTYTTDEQQIESTYIYEKLIEEVSVRNEYYAVKSCINKFFTYYKSIYNTVDENLVKDPEVFESLQKQKLKNVKAVYNMLDKEYLTYYNITEDGLTTHLKPLEKMSLNISNMYVSEYSQNISVYFVNGYFVNTATSQTVDFSIMVKLDLNNETFTVLLEDYISEKYGKIEIGQKLEVNYPEKIENNGYNIYDYEIIENDTYITDIFNSFRTNMIYKKQIAYESLDKKYREKRFPTLGDFEKYVKDNIREISIMKLNQYERNNDSGDITYICKDTNENYYRINEITTMKCTFILDTYTIDFPEFYDKYQESENEVKVALNLEKIREAINFKDFQYVYNKTNDTFKNSNFKDFAEFENYLKLNLFEENEFEYKNIKQQSDIHIATVIINGKNNSPGKTKEMEVIMKLTDTTDYSISFNFK